MIYSSTRDSSNKTTALKGILKGIADDGGLFVPDEFPQLTMDEFENFALHTYPEIAADILSRFIDIEYDELLELTTQAYDSYDTIKVAPVAKITDTQYIMELWHGPTLAFKDMALQMLPRLMSKALERENGKKVLILTATSGDTGKAALEGFKDVPNTGIVVFYPNDGVSDMQRLQMTTQPGSNVHICAVNGNFDDAQTGVKRLFTDPEFNKQIEAAGYSLSSANSINLGRLIPQIVYYVHAYSRLIKKEAIQPGDKVNIVVPTGNFGNILAAYYAKRMGMPVNKLICASNSNNILTDFFSTGEYYADREFFKTISPSMDILISSNLERFLYELAGRNSDTVRDWMTDLSEGKEFAVDPDMVDAMGEEFYADFCDDIATQAEILKMLEDHGYLIDTHTAVACSVYDDYKETTGDETVTLIASTANAFKFPQDVYESISGGRIEDPFEAAKGISEETGKAIPPQILGLYDMPVRFTDVAEKEDMGAVVLKALEAFNE